MAGGQHHHRILLDKLYARHVLARFLNNCACLLLLLSHPGYFGKVGMRHFRLQRNQFYEPTINLDKVNTSALLMTAHCLCRLQLWTLVSEQTRENYAENKDGKVPVIDVVNAVSAFAGTIDFFSRDWCLLLLGFLQGARQGSSAEPARYCQG